jgi:hypothetical protein
MGVLEELKSNLSVGARGNKYKVTMNMPLGTGNGGKSLDVMCKGASIPAKTIGTIEVFNQGRKIVVAGDAEFESSWALTFWATQDHLLRKGFETWLDAIDNFSEHKREVSDYTYMTTAQVAQLSTSDNSETAVYEFHNLFPTNISALDLADDANDEILEFEVEFAYSHWIRKDN